MDRRGLPNNVFGVWGKGDPPAVGLDDRGHRGLLGGHTTLDALVIFQDAVEMGEGDRSLGMVGLCECGGGWPHARVPQLGTCSLPGDS